MPFFSSDIKYRTINYDAWRTLAENNKVRYVEYSGSLRYLGAFGKLGKSLFAEIVTSGSISDFETVFKPSGSVAADEDELIELTDLDSKIGTDEGRQQKAYEFGTSVIYIGYSNFGIATSGSGWTIKKVILDGSGNPTTETWTSVEGAIWDNRTTEYYF